MKKGKKIIVIGVSAAALLLAVAGRLLKPAEELPTRELPTVRVSALEKGSIESEISLMGTIAPSDTYYVMPKTAGELIEVYVKNGDSVKAGDPIAKIDNQKQVDAAKYTLEQATVQAETSGRALNRMRPLFEAGDISAQEYESAKAGAEAAAAAVKSAKLNYDTQLEFSTVTAPADGVVQNAAMTVNAMVGQSSQLCVVTGTGAKSLRFNVTEDVLGNLSMGQELRVEKSGTVYHGVISDIGRLVSPASGLFPVEATMEDASGLPDGSSAKLTLVSEHAENAELLPLDCIYYSGGQPYVYVYQDGKVSRAFLTLGVQNESHAQVLEGVDGSSRIVSSWTNELYDGAEVQLSENGETAG